MPEPTQKFFFYTGGAFDYLHLLPCYKEKFKVGKVDKWSPSELGGREVPEAATFEDERGMGLWSWQLRERGGRPAPVPRLLTRRLLPLCPPRWTFAFATLLLE